MRRIVMTMALLATVLGPSGRAQEDPQALVNAVATAIGAADLTTLEFSGSGTVNTFGQSWKHDVPWPEFRLVSYAAAIDYRVPAMRIAMERDNPERGKPMQGGGYPLLAPERTTHAVNGKAAWDIDGAKAVTPSSLAGDRILEIWSTPHGVVRAARAAGSAVKAEPVRSARGETTGTVLTFPVEGANFRVTVTMNNLISRVDYVTDTAMLGDTTTTVLYAGYRDYGNIKFPSRLVRLRGAVPSVGLESYQTLTLTVDRASPNANVSVDVPPTIQSAAATSAAPSVTVDKVAAGVYLLGGQEPNSVAIEFADHAVLVEAPLNEAVTLARFEAMSKLMPGKPVRFVLSTHHHFDHAGGIRAAAADGLTLLVPGWSRAWYDRVLAAPHTLNPDRFAKAPTKPTILDIGTAYGSGAEMRELTDGKRTLRVYRVQGSQHADALLVGYLPVERILIEADMFRQSASDTPVKDLTELTTLPLTYVSEPTILHRNIQRLGIQVNTVVPLHGRPAKFAELLAAAGIEGN